VKKKPVTIYDIASELNVSPSTVSRALKNHYSIGKVTTRKVKALAAERGYRPNSLAANPGKRMNNIGVIVPQINRPLVSTIISGIEEVAHKNGFNVIIGQSHDALASEVALANSFHAARVGGIVLLPSSQEIIEDHFDVFVDDNIPFILLDNKPDVIKLDRIIVDYFTVAKLATAHLIDQGCKRIAMTSDPQ
jgi:LacI family transcriptional regulator